METAAGAMEGDPLKSNEDGAETGATQSTTALKQMSCKETLGLAKLNHWRTGVFFFSLFLCLTIVFAFSFIIPCPVRPQYLPSWNRTFDEAGTYDFLDFEDASKDNVIDVLFVVKSTEGSQNNSCTSAVLPSPCAIMIAVDGTHGETLWERPLAPEFHWAQCGLEEGTRRTWDCLVSHSDQITAIDKYTGDVMWHQPQPSGLNITVPVLGVPDLDKDGVPDVVLLVSDNKQTQLRLLSGKMGTQIGSTVVLDSIQIDAHLLHRTKEGSHYVILQKDSGVYGLALWRIAAQAKAGIEADLLKDKQWEKNANTTTGLITIYASDSVRQILNTKLSDDPPNLLLVTGTEVALIDGTTLELRWIFNSSTILSEPSFGHFDKDDVLDVVIEEDIGNNTKRVRILDGKSGGVLWQVNLLRTQNMMRPGAIHTTNSFSVFVFWGLMPSSEPSTSDQHSYLLHPLYSNVLLESTSSFDHIVAFKALLLEHGRHAAFIFLTGPETEGADGTVVLSKRKLKQDVPLSLVRSIDSGEVSDVSDDIKQVFNRLRFSDW